MKIAIVTGGSRGLGLGIVKAYLSEGYEVYSLARSVAEVTHKRLHQIEVDLTIKPASERIFSNLLEAIHEKSPGKVVLINNAGIIGGIARIENQSISNLEWVLDVNLGIPFMLAQQFISHAAEWPVQKRIVNISSGAAHKPYGGWAAYCASKAALDMFTRCIALEQQSQAYPVEAMGIYPGVVDTDMQAEIREADPAAFDQLPRFLELKKTNALAKAGPTGKKITAMEIGHFENGTIKDIRDFD